MNYINTTFKRNATKALTLFVILLTSVNAWAVDYIKPNGAVESVEATTITSSTFSLTTGWYAVTSDVTNANRLIVPAGNNVNIILCDEATFTNAKGITVEEGASLTIWGQPGFTGTWNITSPDDNNAGIGGANANAGTININGGTINVVGGQYGAGIGGGKSGHATISINAGVIVANRNNEETFSIGDGNGGSGSTIAMDYDKINISVYSRSYSGTVTLAEPFFNSYVSVLGPGVVSQFINDRTLVPGGCFAAWCEDNHTLYFDNFDYPKVNSKIPLRGDTYQGHVVTEIWHNDEVIKEEPHNVYKPWNGIREQVQAVVINQRFNKKQLPTCSHWFYYFNNMTSITGLRYLNTSNVKSMAYMFLHCSSLQSLDLTGLNTSNVTNMTLMFDACSALTVLDVSNIDVSKVTGMDGMFDNCTALTTIYSNRDWNNGGEISSAGMFRYCYNLKGVIAYDESKIDVTYANPTTGYFTERWNVNMPEFEGGTLVCDDTYPTFNKEVTLTLAILPGFELQNLSVTGDTSGNTIALTDHGDGTYTFTMPAEDVHVNVSVELFSEELYYTDLSGNKQHVTAKLINSNVKTLTNGWYAMTEDVVTTNRLAVQGSDVNLILCDGDTLTCENGITIDYNDNKLTVWGQAEGTGTLIAHGYDADAAIGGNGYYSGVIIINGGIINATSHAYGAAIGGGMRGNTDVTINGGKVTARAEDYGAAIGGGRDTEYASIIAINGGSIHATSGYHGTGIGTGRNSYSSYYLGDTQITLSYNTNVEIYADSYDGMITVNKRFHDGNTIIEPGTINAVIDYESIFNNDPFAYKTLWSFTGDALMDYLALDGTTKKAMVKYITNSTTTLTNGWWAVNENVTLNDRIESIEDEDDNINIILCDGKTFDHVGGYYGKNLSIWGQEEGTGMWYITYPEDNTTGMLATGTLAFNGGTVWVQAAGDYSEAIVGADSVIINRGRVFAIPDIESDNLIICDGAQLIHMNEGVTATVQKNIAKYTVSQSSGETMTNGWHFIASPVCTSHAPDATMLSNDFDLYRLNNTLWENWKKEGDHYHFNLENSLGYLYANSEDVTLEFKGAILPAVDSKDVNVDAGFNLIGNPFLYNVYANRVYYRMNDERTGIVAVENYHDNPITPCTGIIVNADAAGTVTFSMVAPALANDNGSMQITLAKMKNERASTGTSTVIDNAIVSFREGSQLEKFHFGNDAKVYIPQGGKDYAIAFSEGQGEMPLNFKATENGEYTLTMNPEGVELAYLHLVDNLTGADVDLLVSELVEGPASYTFTAKTTDYESRFKLVFATNNQGGASTGSSAFAFISNGNIIITADVADATLQIVDVLGRVVREGDAMNSVSTGGFVPGVYVLRLINGNDVKTQKMVIQ